MKKTIFSTIIASLLVFAGCQNEELVKESTDNSGKKVTLTAHIAGSADSRVTLDDVNNVIKMGWRKDANNPETFTVYNEGLDDLPFVQDLKLDADGNTFSCEREIDEDFFDDNTHAYYGYTLTNTGSNYTLSYNLSEQDGTLNEDYVLMQAPIAENSTDITFQHKTAILEFVFNNGEYNNTNIKSIVINNVKNVSEGLITVPRTNVANDKKGDIYIFLPIENANDYTVGHTFNFTVTDNDDNEYTGSLSIKKSIELGKRYTAKVNLEETVNPEGIDLGLSVLWAPFNIGATSPEGYGDYFAWGETDPYPGNTYCSTFEIDRSVLISDNIIDENGNLTAEYDAATANWGNGWRMPTYKEWDELVNGCKWKQYTQNGIKGYLGTSKTNNRTIFLPFGSYYKNNDEPSNYNYGYLWLATVKTSNTEKINAACAIFYYVNDYMCQVSNDPQFSRRNRLPVRPVKSK